MIGVGSLLVFVALAILPTRQDPPSEPYPEPGPVRWFKGNTHTQSLWSDGNDFPEMIAEWYRTHGGAVL